VHDAMEAAIQREKQIKEWRRAWKISLIEHDNRHWVDLSPNLSR
jgi:putative endonuclease